MKKTSRLERMRIAVGQFSASLDKSANCACILRLAEEAARSDARLAVFPEASMADFGAATDDLSALAEPLDGPFVRDLSRLAARLSLTIVAGMFEAIPSDQRVHNTAVVIDPVKGLVAAYRKRHLFDAFGDRESDRISPGTSGPPMVQVQGFTAAVVICYDLRFPSFIEHVADQGAELLLVPSAWASGPLKEEHWSVLLRARAIENTMYVAAAGQAGRAYCGLSMVVDPLGVMAASLGETDGVAVAEVSKERLAAVRGRLPLLTQRRAGSQ